MRFRRLDVRAYRAIDQAELEFGPGLNVLYGPNDLGKSTLAAGALDGTNVTYRTPDEGDWVLRLQLPR